MPHEFEEKSTRILFYSIHFVLGSVLFEVFFCEGFIQFEIKLELKFMMLDIEFSDLDINQTLRSVFVLSEWSFFFISGSK